MVYTGGEGFPDSPGILARHQHPKRGNKTLIATDDSGRVEGEIKL
jgi:hypothetical protein